MGEEKGNKLSALFSIQETVAFLRNLADGLEMGKLVLGSIEQPVEGQAKIKASVKAKEGKTGLKLKVRFLKPEAGDGIFLEDEEEDSSLIATEPSDVDDVEDDDDESKSEKKEYKKLKKAMQKEFKALADYVSRGEMAPEENLNIFLDQCRLMTSFEGYGDEYYLAFGDLTSSLADAAEAGDVAAFKGFFEAIAQMKDDCHKEYK